MVASPEGAHELRGVAAQRSRLHLSYRLGARAYLFATARAGRKPRVAAAIGAGVDVATWAVLRRTDRLLFGPRLALDVGDVATTSLVAGIDPEAASLVGVPLAMEAGIRGGGLGLVVPAAHLAAVTALRRRAGHRTAPTTFAWQVMGAVMGNLLSWYERREGDATVARHGQELAALKEAAWLAGQNAMALGADTVVDELARLEYLLGVLGNGDAETGSGQILREWKASLASTTASRAAYLGTTLSRWSRSRQDATLAHDVQIDLPPGDGTVILSARQAQVLVSELDGLGLVGDVEVQVRARSDRALPGDSLGLRVGRHEVALLADPVPLLRPFDPAPLVILAGGLWCLGLSSDSHGGAPLAVTVPSALATVPLAWWCRRSLTDRRTEEAAEAIVLGTIAHALLVALVATRSLSAPLDRNGAQAFPATMTLLSASVLAARYERTLTTAARRRVLAAAAVALAVSLVPARQPIRWVDLMVGAVELVTVYLSFNRVQAELDRSAEELAAVLRAESEQAQAESLEEGRRLVIGLVSRAAGHARRRLAAQSPDWDAAIANQTIERLRTIDMMLADLQ